MEHYELEDVFGRRLRPSLKLGVVFGSVTNPPREGVTFALFNEDAA
jgi:hypothetical protein